MRFRTLATVVGLSLPFAVAIATAFTDVPASHPYSAAIYDLQRRGIITGNPDGTFAPKRPLNRAELLTLIYRATDKETRPVYGGCFPDVPTSAWFSDIVCTAKHNGDVQGNPDGTFRPESNVNLVEALKMILTTFKFTIPSLTQEDRLSLDFLGVTHGSWYAPYLHRTLALDLLPSALTKNNVLNVSAPLLREEAAEIIYRALYADDSIDNTPAKKKDDSNNPPKVTPTGMSLVDFPVHRTGKTGERGATAFAFEVKTPGTILVEATNLTSASAGIKCYLYLLGESGFSSEFFIGYEEGGSCFIRGALRAGQYQVEVRSPSEGADYSLDAAPVSENDNGGTGDGNDGFLEAVSLRVGAPRSASLTSHDYEDWYHFSVSTKEPHRVKLSSTSSLACNLFPASNVDLSSFEAPVCGDTADFDPGDWYISVKKTKEAAGSQNYVIELR